MASATAALVVLVGVLGLGAVRRGELIGPDSIARLLRLHQMIDARHPIEALTGQPGGKVTLYWSHLLDTFILLGAAPLSPWIGWSRALEWAGLAVGPLSLGGLAAAAGWSVAPLASGTWRRLIPVGIVVSQALTGYGIPGIVHHHVLLAVAGTVIAGLAGRCLRGEGGRGP